MPVECAKCRRKCDLEDENWRSCRQLQARCGWGIENWRRCSASLIRTVASAFSVSIPARFFQVPDKVPKPMAASHGPFPPQRVARAPHQSHSHLHFVHSTRAISAEGCAHRTNRTFACISRTRHARSPQRIARAPGTSHSRLHFAHSKRTISVEGCAHRTNRTFACISRTRHARSPQRVALLVDAVRPTLRL